MVDLTKYLKVAQVTAKDRQIWLKMGGLSKTEEQSNMWWKVINNLKKFIDLPS